MCQIGLLLSLPSADDPGLAVLPPGSWLGWLMVGIAAALSHLSPPRGSSVVRDAVQSTGSSTWDDHSSVRISLLRPRSHNVVNWDKIASNNSQCHGPCSRWCHTEACCVCRQPQGDRQCCQTIPWSLAGQLDAHIHNKIPALWYGQ